MRKYLLLLILFLFCNSSFAQGAGEESLNAELEEVLHIEKIIVEGVEYDKDDEVTNAQIKSVKDLGGDCYEFSLTPFTIKIKNNLADSIQVTADFKECCSCDGKCSLPQTDLMVEPKSCIIKNPYNMVESARFTPKFVGHSDTNLTTYRGKLVITLGKV